MSEGLAQMYGQGEGQNTGHYYAGTMDKGKKKKAVVRKRPKTGKCKSK